MNKAVEKYIPEAMKVLEEYEKERKKKEKKDEDKKIEKEMKGYIASLGASILISGLVPTLAFYTSNENSSKADRGKVLEWTRDILRDYKDSPYQNILQSDTDLFKHAYGLDRSRQTRLEQDILDVSIALKLCIRTFKLTKD